METEAPLGWMKNEDKYWMAQKLRILYRSREIYRLYRDTTKPYTIEAVQLLGERCPVCIHTSGTVDSSPLGHVAPILKAKREGFPCCAI